MAVLLCILAVVMVPRVAEAQANNTTTAATTTLATTTPVGPPSCPNTQMTNILRGIFLDTHNNLRGSLARGQTERRGTSGEIAPPASLMYRMRYDCNAESYAQQHVNSCDRVLSDPAARPGYKENINILDRTDTTPEGAAQWALTRWWGQLARNGVPSNMIFSEAVRNRQTGIVTKFTKMAWWDNINLGCAVRNCNSFYFTSCMYGPGGNIVGSSIYTIGAVCSGCPAGCVGGLCPAP